MNTPVRWADHLPALALLLAMLGVLALGWPWPDPVADGWDAQGQPIHWRWAPAVPEAALTFWLVSFALDLVWAVFERRRRIFSPLALLDEALIGWMLVRLADFGVANGMAPVVRVTARLAGGLALVAAVALELRRVRVPLLPAETRRAEDVTDLASELSTLRAPGQAWSYWSAQRLPYQLLIVALGVAFVLGAVAIPDGPLWARALFLCSGLLTLAICGDGLRAVVTPRRFVLRAGYLGLPLLRLEPSDITEVSVPDFDPVRDFGGWGIRRGMFGAFAGVRAFNFGDAGVLLRTRQGKRYLIGADHPDRLAAALNAARVGGQA